VGEYAAGEFVRHLIQSSRPEIVGGNEWEDGRASVGSAVHISDVDFVERRLAYAKDQQALLFEAYVGGALDQVRSNAVGDTGKSTDATRDDDHRAGRIRPAGDVSSDIGIRLLMNFSRLAPDELSNEVATTAKAEFFSDDAKCAIGGDEVDVPNTNIAISDGEQVAGE